jgi:DNA-directed RNA polymerase specialized sigma subunit
MDKENLKKTVDFEDCLPEIDQYIAKRRRNWNLSSLAWMDYDDVSQILRLHLYKKWEKYDPNQPLGPWVNRIITRQIKNLIRNHFSNYARPCVRCPASQADEGCEVYKTQCIACPLFATWKKRKENAYNIKLPVSLENHPNEDNGSFGNDMDMLSAIEAFNKKMKTELKPIEWTVYKALYIDSETEMSIAKKLGYRTTEKNRSPGYKQIKNIQKAIIEKAERVVSEGLIEII